MTGQDPFDRIRTYLDIAQRAFEEIVDTYAPAEDEGFDEVRDVLDKLGVDKPLTDQQREDKLREWFTSQETLYDVIKTVGETEATDALINAAVERIGTILADDAAKGDLWEIAIKDGHWGSAVEVRADKVRFGVDIDGTQLGFAAYLDGTEIFHAPAGEYHYARKVSEK